MAVLNKRAVVSAIELYGVSAIRLPMVLGESFDQLIKSLFANGEQGFFYDPNDLTTMWQDAAGTVPVTGAGQSVGLIKDKSGRNNHAYQSVSASRPILQRNATTGAYYLAFDGADDFLVTNSIDFTAANKMSLFTGLERTGNATIGTVLETGSNYITPTGGFGVQYPHIANGNTVNLLASSSGATVNTAGANAPNVLTYAGFIDLSKTTAADQLKFRVNGAYDTVGRANLAGNGNFANIPVYIGRRAGTSNPLNGRIYSLIGISRLTTGDETIALEKELAKRIGVTLSV